VTENPETFPRLLAENVRTRGDQPAYREKDLGIWNTWSWREAAAEIRAIACGLAKHGFERGDRLAIVGDNRPELYWSMVAAQCLGGIPVPLYQDSVADEMRYVLGHAEARFAVVEDQEQVDKLLEIMSDCPALELIVYKDPRGLRHYDQSCVMSLADLVASGRERDRAEPGFYDAEIAKGAGSDTAIILYTSGTTGQPKGVMLSNDNLIITARNSIAFDNLADENVLAYLPMAWVGDNIFSIAQAYIGGFCVNCPESTETVLSDLRELGPTYFFAPPRIWENLLTQVTIRMEDAAWFKRKLFRFFIDHAQRCGGDILARRKVSIQDRLIYAIGDVLIYGPLKNTLGFSRIRIAYTAGEAIGAEIFEFYRSLGMNVKQLYGMTEASVFICMQPDGEVDPETVGVPAPEVEVKIDEAGEVLYRGPGTFSSYFKNPEATAETKRDDGWVASGDAGYFGPDGHLRIIDRAKDVGRLADGTLFAPKYLENKLKFYPNIKEVVAFGHEREFVAVMINIDFEALASWAERHDIAYTGYQDLSASAAVQGLIASHIDEVNRSLASNAELAGSQICRFLILHKELDADDGELTRTRKVRRTVIADRYGELVAALYSDRDRVEVDALVTFEDGREGHIIASLGISDLTPHPALDHAA